MAEDEPGIRQRAIKRLEAKREFSGHAIAYVTVNALLVVIWAVTSRPGYFWPIWPMLGWGIGLAFHAWSTFGQRPISEADIRREMERESRRTDRTGM
jgi:2TM domain